MTAPTSDGLTEETIFTWGAPPLKFGAGALDEIGVDVAQYGVKRVLVLTDAKLAGLGFGQRVVHSLAEQGIDGRVYGDVHVEPTDASFLAAVEFAREGGPWDAYVAVGGGSVIDTAKAVNLMITDGGELTDYLNKPIGEGKAPSGQLKPLFAVPTTAGTGAESTAVCILDVLSMKVKTGISHWRLRPTMAIVDPVLTMSLPPEVTAASGMDIVCHALESYTARYYSDHARKQAQDRVAYCGSNPVSDMWSEKAMTLLAQSFRTAVSHGADVAARGDMMLAATFAGMGFGNAGVHIPHANGYPIAGNVKDYRPRNYPQDEAMVPHGESVSLTAPEAFRFTFDAAPERHLRAAALLDPELDTLDDAREQLPTALIRLMRDIGIPNGISAVGYTEADIADLVPGTMKQQRLLTTCAKTPTEDDIAAIFAGSLTNW
ncbi:hydroxyacid-oxoacid transhydrogenase [Agilicoccus flavus]|uniref:hydroxyacid-oxoacid transhydrogenase n=1 Tax=Agilicoccus flavus TaxID=2775968 RepID=UPI001CF6CCE8|nr:hydroxyacid-oxoacid transhydrogenase [Agilicoccus flavus]